MKVRIYSFKTAKTVIYENVVEISVSTDVCNKIVLFFKGKPFKEIDLSESKVSMWVQE